MKKKTDVRAQILAALEKLGPSSPRQILDKVGGPESRLSYYLNVMAKAGALRAGGVSSARVYALPSQKLDGASSVVVAAAPPIAEIRTAAVRAAADATPARAGSCRIVLVEADGLAASAVLQTLAELLKAA